MLVFFLLWKLLTIKQRPLPSTNHMKSTVSSIHIQLWWFFFGHFISANTHFTDSSADWRIKVLLVHQTQFVYVGCVLFAPVGRWWRQLQRRRRWPFNSIEFWRNFMKSCELEFAIQAYFIRSEPSLSVVSTLGLCHIRSYTVLPNHM